MVSLTWNVRNRQIHWYQKQANGCQGLGPWLGTREGIGEWTLAGVGFRCANVPEWGRRTSEWQCWQSHNLWWTWVWASSGNWWWTGKPSVLQSVGLQRVRRNWATELSWTDEGQYPEFSYRLDIEVKRGKAVIPVQAKGALLGRKWVRAAVVVSSSYIVRTSTQESNTQYYH